MAAIGKGEIAKAFALLMRRRALSQARFRRTGKRAKVERDSATTGQERELILHVEQRVISHFKGQVRPDTASCYSTSDTPRSAVDFARRIRGKAGKAVLNQ